MLLNMLSDIPVVWPYVVDHSIMYLHTNEKEIWSTHLCLGGARAVGAEYIIPVSHPVGECQVGGVSDDALCFTDRTMILVNNYHCLSFS